MTANPAYYLDDFADEVLPEHLEEPTLEGWAKWLGESRCYHDAEPAPADGTVYKASRLDFDADICVEHRTDADGESTLLFSREGLSEYDFAAVRFGPDMGWEADTILDPTGNLEDQLAQKDCPLVEVGDEEFIAVAKSANILLVYRADPPRLLEHGASIQ